MRVVVTGAGGFLGSHLCEACLERGWEVTAVDALTDYYSPAVKRENISAFNSGPRCNFVEGDIAHLDLAPLLDGADLVFHLAAQPGVRASWGENFHHYVANNVTATQLLLEAARRSGISRFVYASSSSVYGNAQRLPTGEDCALEPISPYGATKLLGEKLVSIYRHTYGTPAVTLRYFSLFGPRQRPDMAFHRLIQASLRSETIEIFGDGNQTRDFTFVGDAVNGTLLAADRGLDGGIYNLGAGRGVSLNEVIEMIGPLTGSAPRVRRTSAQRGDARDTAADIRRARAEIGYEPTRTLEEGLREQVEWHTAAASLLTAG
jgi:nucleoside-diphosphate-sugar epimerase